MREFIGLAASVLATVAAAPVEPVEPVAMEWRRSTETAVQVIASDLVGAEPGNDSAAVVFARSGAVASPLTVHYTLSGTADPGADYAALPGSVTIPAGQRTATVVVSPLDDMFSEVAETVIFTVSPGPGYAVGARSSATVYVTSDDGPADLTFSSVTVPSFVVVSGSAVEVTDTVRNDGSGSAGAFAIRFYLSSDVLIDAGDAQVGARSVGVLAPGASNSATTNVVIPAATGAGTYYILARADDDRVVKESSEMNNVNGVVVRLGGDLVISSMTAPSTLGAGSNAAVTAVVANTGSTRVGASRVGVYLSGDVQVDSSDVLLTDTLAAPALDAGASATLNTTVTIPSNTRSGDYYVIAVADLRGEVFETIEANNNKGTYTRIGGDLVVTEVWAPATVRAGAEIAVTETTKNTGPGPTEASTTGFYLSKDMALDDGDVRLGSGRPVGTLAANASSSGSTTVTIPATTPHGEYYVLAVGDWAKAVNEVNEANNSRPALTTVTDVVVTSMRTIRQDGGRVAWHPTAELIAMDAKGADGLFDVYTIEPSGLNLTCLTCARPEFETTHVGNPAWHPGGRFLAFQALEPVLSPVEYGESATPGAGLGNNVWVMDVVTLQVWRVTDVDLSAGGGVLHPHFSPDGTRLLWAQRVGPGGRMGLWELRLADFSVSGGTPVVVHRSVLKPGAQQQFYESHGFSPDAKEIIFSGNLQPGQAENLIDIYRMNLATGAVTDLTGHVSAYDEHGHWSPDGRKVLWMSSYRVAGDTVEPGSRTDYWMMNANGSGWARLTFFNDSRYPEYLPGGAVASDLSWSPDGRRFVAFVMYGINGAGAPQFANNSRVMVIEISR